MTRPAPRLLTDEEAASYLNVPRATLRREGWGRVRMGVHTRYDRHALDAHLDSLSGLAPSSPAAANGEDDDPDAALDRFVSRG